jgi:LysM repeat protein
MVRKAHFIVASILITVTFNSFLSADSVHVLAQGDTLYSLARQYDVSLDELLEKNHISDPSGLSVGTRLVIPGEEAQVPSVRSGNQSSVYTVQTGDTYYGIARKYGIDIDNLLSLNKRSSDRVLSVGETLVLSRAEITQTIQPVVSPGSALTARVDKVPWWPVAGLKQPMDGKLVGVTIEATPQSYVHAVAGGHVVWTGPYRGFGHVVLVDSNGYIYLYGGNEDLFVNVGQTILAGSRIGRLGSSGPNGGKQDMIFSVFREGIPVSPDDAPRG